MSKFISVIVLSLIVGLGLGYYLGALSPMEEPIETPITSFEECKAAGHPIAESYPEQCFTPDGKGFTREIPSPEEEPVSSPVPRPEPLEPIACPMDAKICPDGTAVGRSGPRCEFTACPGE